MRGQLADEEEEVFGLVNLIPVALMMVAGIVLIGYLIQMQGQLWALYNARLVANTLAGAITAVAAAPEKGVYCVSFPGTYSYFVTIDTAKCDPSSGGLFAGQMCTGGPGGWVAVWSPDRKESGLAFIPITNVPVKTIRLPKGREFVVAFQKHTNLGESLATCDPSAGGQCTNGPGGFVALANVGKRDTLDFDVGEGDFDDMNCTWVV